MKYRCITLLAVLCAGLLTASAWAEDLDYIPNDVVNIHDDPFLKDLAPDKTLSGEIGPTDINQYMIGSISVIVVLPESNESGPNTEDWTDEEIANVHNMIIEGANWWADREPAANLEFNFTFYDRVDIEDEAISQEGIGWWIPHSIDALGYQYIPGTNTYYDPMHDLINDKRIEQGTDWGFIVFVADSSADLDGKFSDGKVAFSTYHHDGDNPYLVMNYENAGYGIENMNNIFAHEMGHIFGAMDEYASICTCTEDAGYLNYENQNCANGCLMDEPSIMKYQVIGYNNNAVDIYARGQIGWTDSDEDGILDILDTFPSLDLVFLESPSSLRFRFSGSAGVNLMPAVNAYYRDSTLNTIAAVEYRVDGGPWLPAAAADGAFDGPDEDYLVDVVIEPGANRLLECRARNSAGNHSEIASTMLDGLTGVPSAARLLALRAYPNPLNPRTTVRFTLDEAGHAALTVYDVGGREVRALFDGGLEAGDREFVWDGCDDAGRAMPSGTYFVRLETARGGATAKVTVAR